MQIPDSAELARRVPQQHPRIWYRPGELERLRQRLDEPDLRPMFQATKQSVDEALGRPLPNFEIPPGFYKAYRAQNEQVVQQHFAIVRPIGVLAQTMQGAALLYRLTDDKRYLRAARDILLKLASLDFEETRYSVTHGFHGLISANSLALDYLWDHLDAADRDAILGPLLRYAREFHPMSVGEAIRNPRDSHAVYYGPMDMTHAALALYHHMPDAEQWLRDVLTYMSGNFPGMGGDDGGWAQGLGYSFSAQFFFLAHMIRVGTGLDFFQIPWGRNNGNVMLYFQPPYGHCATFGDSGAETTARSRGWQKMAMSVFARLYQNPYYQWYADAVEQEMDLRSSSQLLSMFFHWPDVPPPKPPRDLPQSIHLRDVDWVAMHNDLADGDRNVMLMFKSSGYGSYNHNHADQNGFMLEGFSRPLLIDTGYYPWAGSAHHQSWSMQTRAHNTLLFNGKGQGSWSAKATGRVMAFATTDAFDYVAGDATVAYQQPSDVWWSDESVPEAELCAVDQGVEKAIRHIVFIRPDTFVILDDVATQQPASIEFLLHSPNAFEIDEARQTVMAINDPARAVIHLLGPGTAQLSQNDQFSDPPEHGSSPTDMYVNQWHLTADYAPTESARRLLTVIQVARDADVEGLPTVEGFEDAEAVGARIGNTTVRFRLNMPTVAVSCRTVCDDGTYRWFECTAPA